MGMRSNSKWLVLPLTVGLIATALAGCGSSDSADSSATGSAAAGGTAAGGSPAAAGSASAAQDPQAQSGTITIWGWAEGLADDYMKAFNEVYPNIKMNYVPTSDYLQKLQTAVAAGTDLPDIVWAEIGTRGVIYNLNILDNLTEAPYNFDPSIFVDSVLPLMKNSQGEIVGIENGVNPAGFAYRRDLAKTYLGTDDPDQLAAMLGSWDDFIAKGKEVAAASGGKVLMMPGIGDAYGALIGQADTGIIQDQTIDTQGALKNAFEVMQQLRDSGVVGNLTPSSPSWNSSFAAGSFIFYPAAIWSPSYVIKPNDKDGSGRWGIMVPPGGGYSAGGTAFGIPKSSKNKELAWTYLKWILTTQEGAEAGKKMDGFYVPLKSTLSDPAFIENKDPFFGGEDIGELFLNKIAPTMKTHTVSPYDSDINDVSNLVVQAMQQDKSIDAAKALELWKKNAKEKMPDLTIQ